MSGWIKTGSQTPLNQQPQGTLPNVESAMTNWFQPIVFGIVTKTVEGFQVVENMVEISFRGVIQPLDGRKLELKPEGQRQWDWLMVHSDPSLNLELDSVLEYLGTQYRVMSKKDYSQYGYVYYEIVNDYTGSGPEVTA